LLQDKNNPKLYTLEPPCGSNTYILQIKDELLFVDSGFSCYKKEMAKLFKELIPNFKSKPKTSFITHADVDHVGLLNTFDKNYMSQNCYENFALEQNHKKDFREQNPAHEPYCVLSKIISDYQIPDLEKCVPVSINKTEFEIINQIDKNIFTYIGNITFSDYDFLFFEGNGGHVKGETIILCEKLKLLFTGDIFVNIKGFSPQQKEFNSLAPFLMTGVDENPDIAKAEREYIKQIFAGYTICPGHGAIMCL
jgi:glyoxylase-like metal-dependent hydrolase (beta-lactamase superfamily II)